VSVLQGPLGAMLGLAVLVWLGMAISVATLLRRADVPAARAYLVCLALWPLVLRRVRQLRAAPPTGPGAAGDHLDASGGDAPAHETSGGDGTGTAGDGADTADA
jgi:hypothetical protein